MLKRKRIDNEDRVEAKRCLVDIISPLSGDSVTIENLTATVVDVPDNSIANSKLQTITEAGKVENSATTATHADVPYAIVSRNNLGGIDVGYVQGEIITDSINPIATSITITGNEIDATSTTFAANAVIATTSVEAASVIAPVIMTPANTSLELSPHGTGIINANAPIQMASGSALITNSVTGTDGLLDLEATSVNVYATSFGVNATLKANTITPMTSGSDLSLNASGSNAVAIGTNGLKFSNSTIPGYTASAITNYEEATVSISFSGSWAATSYNVKFVREKTLVTMFLPQMQQVATVSGQNIFAAAGAVPERFRPATEVNAPFFGRDNGAIYASPACVTVQPTGAISIDRTFASGNRFFTVGAGTSGIYSNSMTYFAS